MSRVPRDHVAPVPSFVASLFVDLLLSLLALLLFSLPSLDVSSVVPLSSSSPHCILYLSDLFLFFGVVSFPLSWWFV